MQVEIRLDPLSSLARLATSRSLCSRLVSPYYSHHFCWAQPWSLVLFLRDRSYCFCIFLFFFRSSFSFLLPFFCLFAFILFAVSCLALGFHVWITEFIWHRTKTKEVVLLYQRKTPSSLSPHSSCLSDALCSPPFSFFHFSTIILSPTQPLKNTRTPHNVRKPGEPPPISSNLLQLSQISTVPVFFSFLAPCRLSRTTANLLLPSSLSKCSLVQPENIKSSLLAMVVSESRVLPSNSSNSISTMNTTRQSKTLTASYVTLMTNSPSLTFLIQLARKNMLLCANST